MSGDLPAVQQSPAVVGLATPKFVRNGTARVRDSPTGSRKLHLQAWSRFVDTIVRWRVRLPFLRQTIYVTVHDVIGTVALWALILAHLARFRETVAFTAHASGREGRLALLLPLNGVVRIVINTAKTPGEQMTTSLCLLTETRQSPDYGAIVATGLSERHWPSGKGCR